MQKISDKNYEQTWYKSDETRRQVSALFDSWAKMNEYEFQQQLTQLRIPFAVGHQIVKLQKEGNFYEAAIVAQKYGLTPASAEQAYAAIVVGDSIKELLNNPNANKRTIAEDLGKLKTTQMIAGLQGLRQSLRAYPDVQIQQFAGTVDDALSQLNNLTGEVVDNAKTIAIWAGILTAAGPIMSIVGPLLVKVFTGA
jgi:hypothetical protein